MGLVCSFVFLEKFKQRKGKPLFNEGFRSYTERFIYETAKSAMIDQGFSEKSDYVSKTGLNADWD